MLVEVTATNSFMVSRPVSTPWVHSTGMRSSSPPVPFGIFVKSPTADALLLGGEGAMVGRDHLQRAGAQAGPEASWCFLSRNGGDITRRAAWSQSWLKYSLSSSVRCWISGSP